MISDNSADKLVERAAELVAAAKRAGADEVDAVVMRARSVSVSVRLGKVEGTESSESDDFALRVFVGRRIASVSANAGATRTALPNVWWPWRGWRRKILMNDWPIRRFW